MIICSITKQLILFSLPNNLFYVDNLRRIFIPINSLVLKGLKGLFSGTIAVWPRGFSKNISFFIPILILLFCAFVTILSMFLNYFRHKVDLVGFFTFELSFI